MARPNIESAAAPAAPSAIESHIQLGAGTLMAVAAGVAATFPGVLIGAAVAALWRWYSRPSIWLRLICAAALALVVLPLSSVLAPAWLWRDMAANALPTFIKGVDGAAVWRSLGVEALLGPLTLEAAVLATILARRRVGAQVRRDHKLDKLQWRAFSGRGGPFERARAMLPDPHTQPFDATHPVDAVRIGRDGETNQPLDLALPSELANHVFLPGATGSGKTTTLTRLADGALASGYGVVFIDCKGSDLGDTARDLADRYGLPLFVVDPDDEETLGYNPCSGDGASVANKLVGAFAFGPNAEIYKNIAMEAIPLAVEGLLATDEDVTLETLYDALGVRGFANIAHKLDPDDASTRRLRKRLLELGSGDRDKIGGGGQAGLRHRLGALLEGKFGPLFRAEAMLDWDEALAEPSVTYIALSTLASSEDVELMGRVVAQDLKQVCARRLRALRADEDVVPALAVFDEFASLNEAEQLTGLLIQARQALMPAVVATQYIPETTGLRKSVLSAGLIIAHRVESKDAEDIAGQLGTHLRTELTNKVDFETGFADEGSVKRVPAYNVSPNILRTLATGVAVLRSTARNRHAIVHVYRDGD